MGSGSGASARAGRDRVFLACLLVVAALLLGARLGDRALWQDEAETALLARSVLREGVPTAWDGRNWISQEGAQEFGADDHRWFWTPWLQHYLAAGSFALLGESTSSARAPFVLFGLGCLVATYALAFEVTRRRRAARIAMLLLVVSVPFLLHVRQCRYYAPLAFFLALLVHEYLRSLEGRRLAHVGFAVAATGLFHCHYVVFGGCLFGLGLHYAIGVRDRRHWRRLAGALAITAVLAAPFALRFAAQSTGQALPGLEASLASLRDALFHLNRYVFPAALLLVAVGVIAADRRPDAQPEAGERQRLLALVLVALGCVAALVVLMPWFFFRHYVGLIAIGAVLQAWIVDRVWRWQPAGGIALLLALALTDLLPRALPLRQVIPRQSVRHLRTGDEDPARVVGAVARFTPLAAYLYEITHDRTGPIEETVRHLRAHAQPGDTVIATYGDLPLQFYTDLKVVGGLSGEDPAPHRGAEWLLVRTHTHRAGDHRLKRFIAGSVDLDRYAPTTLPAADTPYENRPDPTYHKFRDPVPGEALPAVRIWRRRAGAPAG